MKNNHINSNGNRIGLYFIYFNAASFYGAASAAFSDLFNSFLIENGLNLMIVLFLYLGVIIGGILWSKIYKNVNNPYNFCFLNFALAICISITILIKQEFIIAIIFTLLGFFGASMLIGLISFFKMVTTIENRGKTMGIFVIFVGLFFLLSALFSIYIPSSENVFLIIILLFTLNGILTFYFKKKKPLGNIEKIEDPIIHSLDKQDFFYYSISIFLIFFVIGICIWQVTSNLLTHNIAVEGGRILFGDLANTTTGMENTNVFTAASICISAYPFGYLFDRIGRRDTTIFGLFITCIGMFLFGFFYNLITLIFAWLLLGIGIGIYFNLATTLFIDVEFKRYKSYLGVPWFTFFTGLGLGMIIGWLTRFYEFSYISLLILIAFPTGIFAITHAKDSLPSQEEREWRDCVKHLFLIQHNGVCLIHYPFLEEKVVDEQLFAGWISSIIMLIQELTSSDEKIEVFSQKDAKILVKYGRYITGALLSSKELKILHHKLKDLLQDFEDIFHDYLEEGGGDVERFEPGNRLIKRHFKKI